MKLILRLSLLTVLQRLQRESEEEVVAVGYETTLIHFFRTLLDFQFQRSPSPIQF